ncbi:MAG: DUF2231 domain-containing protein [Anaerolineaceae bacterium]|nr:DUF2231 domain-containing protein [Anaerolineaceae bacterium]
MRETVRREDAKRAAVQESLQQEGIKSTAAIVGHPIHPMLIPFPIAFLTGALVTDIVYWATEGTFWARMSLWLLVAGLIMGGVAAFVGLIDFLTIERARALTIGWWHLGSNAVALVLALVNVLVRWNDPAATALPTGLILSAVTAVLLGVGGWYGGELAYRHKIGVIEHEEA